MWLYSPVMVLGPVAELVVLIAASARRSPATAGREDKLNFHPVTPQLHSAPGTLGCLRASLTGPNSRKESFVSVEHHSLEAVQQASGGTCTLSTKTQVPASPAHSKYTVWEVELEQTRRSC